MMREAVGMMREAIGMMMEAIGMMREAGNSTLSPAPSTEPTFRAWAELDSSVG